MLLFLLYLSTSIRTSCRYSLPKWLISPNLVDRDSLPSSILSVNGLVFTFRIAYQNSTCSIFVLMLIQSDNSLPSFWKVLPHIMKRGVV
ncbi:hypothetical protein C7374_102397 [Falsochrobactrum ovis]|uniref:Uncharacterized protein n=1 Tax=Falsochrobactrum ovis TaxID=1293442 RepID=A0A364JY61_9HYPH|nr:hypothetical protein C7374_102397 [Falsochrobactrum ovis]